MAEKFEYDFNDRKPPFPADGWALVIAIASLVLTIYHICFG